MEGSIEMKMQAIDKMIEMRNQLIVMQDNLNMFNGFDKNGTVIIHNTSAFFEIAKHVGAKVEPGNMTNAGLRTMFNYKDVKFVAYIDSEERILYEHEIHRSDANVL